MSAVLQESGIEVLAAEERARPLVLMAGRMRPDAVVLDLDTPASRPLGDRVRNASPQTTVMLWARDEDVMEIVDPGGSGPRRIHAPAPADLHAELLRSQLGRGFAGRE
jgi:DNA-binding response OmpR family regulator